MSGSQSLSGEVRRNVPKQQHRIQQRSSRPAGQDRARPHSTGQATLRSALVAQTDEDEPSLANELAQRCDSEALRKALAVLPQER